MASSKKRITIIGSGHSGRQAYKHLSGFDNLFEVTILTKSSYPESEQEATEINSRIQYGAHVLKIITDINSVRGVLLVDRYTGEISTLETDVIILATGGYEDIFKSTDHKKLRRYGDGIIVAIDAGVDTNEFEMVTIQEKKIMTGGGVSFIPDKVLTNTNGLFAIGQSVALSSRKDFDLMKEAIVDNIRDSIYDKRENADINIKSLSDSFLSGIRVVPDTNTIRTVQEQLGEVMWKTVGVVRTPDSIKASKYLIDIIRDGVERHAIEEYSLLIRTFLLIGKC